jgi:hypothetical protein
LQRLPGAALKIGTQELELQIEYAPAAGEIFFELTRCAVEHGVGLRLGGVMDGDLARTVVAPDDSDESGIGCDEFERADRRGNAREGKVHGAIVGEEE